MFEISSYSKAHLLSVPAEVIAGKMDSDACTRFAGFNVLRFLPSQSLYDFVWKHNEKRHSLVDFVAYSAEFVFLFAPLSNFSSDDDVSLETGRESLVSQA